MKTFIRRPGNKTRHLKHIIPLIPKFQGTYIEPFLGTGAVYLHLLPPKAILNDLNKDIIDIWKLVKSDPEYIINQIDKFKKVFLPMNNTNKLIFCKDILKKMNTYKGKKRTIMYLLMIYCSFNGTVMNAKGEWYVSGICNNIYSRSGSHVFTQDYADKIRNVSKTICRKLYSRDYSDILKQAKPGDFVFLDPPYIDVNKYVFNYNRVDNISLEKLKLELDVLTRNKIKWMMTQADTKQIKSIFKKYNIINIPSDISLKKSTLRSSKKELIIMNY